MDAPNSEIVNTAFFTQGQHPTDRIVTNSGATTVKASTFYWNRPTCADASCGVNGMGFWTPLTGTFAFQTSASVRTRPTPTPDRCCSGTPPSSPRTT